jgi:hypothetical protein
MQRIDGAEAIEVLGNEDWRTEFEVYDEGNVTVFMNNYGIPVAALRWGDNDTTAIHFFETRWPGSGIGGEIIEELKVSVPGLSIGGEIDSDNCARFWQAHGFDMNGVQVSR